MMDIDCDVLIKVSEQVCFHYRDPSASISSVWKIRTSTLPLADPWTKLFHHLRTLTHLENSFRDYVDSKRFGTWDFRNSLISASRGQRSH